jgi:hypothetical protein
VSGRTQKVVINGISSDAANIGAGVPHDAISGLLLFLFFINHIVLDIRSNIILFADDTTSYMIVDEAYRAETWRSFVNNIINMTVPTAIILKNYTKVFMLFDFANDGIVHIDWRMVGFKKKKN